jgi:hypothetical protein
MNRYDLVFMGHVTIDEIKAKEGSAHGVPGGAPYFGAFAASRSRKRIAVVTKMAEKDTHPLEPFKAAGIDVYLRPVHESLRFAATLASIKMETPGPFRGSLEDVLSRMRTA